MRRHHHFLPQFYLKGFVDASAPPGHTPFLWIRDVATGKIQQRAPHNVAAEIGFYAIEKDGQLDYESFEAELSKIESRSATALRKYLAAPRGDRDISESLGEFLAWLTARTPSLRTGAENHLHRFLAETITSNEIALSPTFPLILKHRATGETRREPIAAAVGYVRAGDWIPHFDPTAAVDVMRLQAWYFQTYHFPRLHWGVLTAAPGDTFITSDRPVVWTIPGRGYAHAPAALKDPDVQLTIPLDFQHALIAFGRQQPTANTSPTREINQHTAMHAERFIIASERTFGGLGG